ncbi:helix-turn-helix domain-containing protein [Pseudohalocynthiibacter aestuariivivens]|jgi:Helix-turn-helix domain/RodZ C-terminal domain|uniref:Helix-turn-helix domain-containing protein n=2 Tax=Pseudohalocynthiibacter TaxID=1759417 RepID=A0ABV5JEH1_9RHOB|nr:MULTISPECIES: helix-turn-helix domain-containing protein [Pseudohalocynthiibacter]MBS9718616.1 DUF4115 domain-containing protein [Pseudohalocynthiibacter aestuariivivens]MCK0103627.1 DUF4115 domain-containing protein [Pseudohalocynthiibacter sp. F2068]
MIGRILSPREAETEALKGFDDFDLRLGDIMRGERATMGKSLLDVQRELKIKATYIAAIENCDPSAFETPGFIAGYVRSYARYLSMDPDNAFSTFCKESNFETAHGMSVQASTAKSRRAEKLSGIKPPRDPFADPNVSFVPRGDAMFSQVEPGALGSIAVLAALIGLIGFGGWTVLREVQQVQFIPVEQTPGIATSIDPLVGTSNIIVASGETETQSPNAEALERLYRPEALDVPVLVARDGPIVALDPARFGTFAGLAADTQVLPSTTQTAQINVATEEDTSIQVVADDAPELVLVAARPAWVRVRGAGGTVIFEKVMDAGEEYVLPQTEEPPVLRVGESGAIYFAVNGQHYGPSGPDGIVTSNIVLTAEKLTETYSIADLNQDSDLARMVAEAQTAQAEVQPTAGE